MQGVWWLMLSGFAVTECLRPAEVTSIKSQTHTSCLRGLYQIRAHYWNCQCSLARIVCHCWKCWMYYTVLVMTKHCLEALLHLTFKLLVRVISKWIFFKCLTLKGSLHILPVWKNIHLCFIYSYIMLFKFD